MEGLSYIPGLTSWQCTSKEGDLYSTWSEVPESLSTTLIRPEHFPTEDKDVSEQLKRCVRVLPHLQNTGGFFVALLEKVEALPWESKREKVFDGEEKENEKKEEPPTKKKRFWGFKEDPFIYCKEGDEAVRITWQFNDHVVAKLCYENTGHYRLKRLCYSILIIIMVKSEVIMV